MWVMVGREEEKRRPGRLTIYTVLLKKGARWSTMVCGTSWGFEGQVRGHRQEQGTGGEVSYLLLGIM